MAWESLAKSAEVAATRPGEGIGDNGAPLSLANSISCGISRHAKVTQNATKSIGSMVKIAEDTAEREIALRIHPDRCGHHLGQGE